MKHFILKIYKSAYYIMFSRSGGDARVYFSFFIFVVHFLFIIMPDLVIINCPKIHKKNTKEKLLSDIIQTSQVRTIKERVNW